MKKGYHKMPNGKLMKDSEMKEGKKHEKKEKKGKKGPHCGRMM